MLRTQKTNERNKGINRKNKKAFNLPKEHRLRGRISDFLLMLNTPEKVDLVRCFTSTEAKDRKDVVLMTFGEKVVFVHYCNRRNTSVGKVEELTEMRPEESDGLNRAIDDLVAPLGDRESVRVAAETVSDYYCRHEQTVPLMSDALFVYSRTGFALNRLEDAINDLIANAGKRGEA